MPPRSISNKKTYPIGVIGTINRDSVTLVDGTVRRGWGGILFNLKGLSDILGKQVEIYPACRVGADNYASIRRMLQSLPGVRLDYIHKVPRKNNHCHLTYHSDEDKAEILGGGVGPLSFTEIRDLLDCDIILMNFISGNDIYLKSLEKFRRLFRGTIYIDIHSFTLGKRPNGKRYLRYPKGWEKVVACGDFIQMNKLELAVLLKEKPEKVTSDKINQYLKRLFRAMDARRISIVDKTFIITDGSRGCVVAHFLAGKPRFLAVRPLRIIEGGDTTGCGDGFAGGFVSGIVQRKTRRVCAELGHKAAGKCLTGGKFYGITSSK